MKNTSIWKESIIKNKEKNKISSKETTDILIIGAGIMGLTTTINLLDADKKIIIIDKNIIGNGITAYSTGKLTLNQGTYSKIESTYDFNMAYKYYKSQKCSLKLINNIIKKYNIDCDYMVSPSTTFIETTNDLLDLEKEENFYKKAKIKYEKVDVIPNNYKIIEGLKVNDMHIFNPVKYMMGLKNIISEKIPIYEGVIALSMKKVYGKYKVRTNKGEILAKKVIVTTHYPFFISPGFIPLKTYIEKSYMLASKVNKTYDMNAISLNKPVISMRYYKEYMIIAANSHMTKDTDNYMVNFNDMKIKFKTNFKGEIKYVWSNHDVMTNDSIPYIGEVDKNLYVATGFNKWGLSCSGVTSKVLSDLVLNKKNEFEELFRLNRSNLVSKFNSFGHNYNVAKTYVKMKLIKKNFSRVTYKREKGKDIAIYKDGKREHKVYNKCPHMGCKLMFNQSELTWDCPCHGSRFNIDGECIFGPSTYSIKVNY